VQEERKCKNSDIIDSVNIEKKHNFVEKIIVIPEICYECHKKFVLQIFDYSYYL